MTIQQHSLPPLQTTSTPHDFIKLKDNHNFISLKSLKNRKSLKFLELAEFLEECQQFLKVILK